MRFTLPGAIILAITFYARGVISGPFGFQIAFNRWDNPICTGDRKLDKDAGEWGVEIGPGAQSCHTFKDGIAFNTFSVDWIMPNGLSNLQEKSPCTLLIYENDQCEGHLVFWIDKVRIFDPILSFIAGLMETTADQQLQDHRS